MPCLRATMTDDTPCCRLSAAISRFCSAVQRRRRSRPVITSMRRLRMLVRLVVGASSESNATAITLSSFLKDDRWPNFPRAAQCAAAISLTHDTANLQQDYATPCLANALRRLILRWLSESMAPETPEMSRDRETDCR